MAAASAGDEGDFGWFMVGVENNFEIFEEGQRGIGSYEGFEGPRYESVDCCPREVVFC